MALLLPVSVSTVSIASSMQTPMGMSVISVYIAPLNKLPQTNDLTAFPVVLKCCKQETSCKMLGANLPPVLPLIIVPSNAARQVLKILSADAQHHFDGDGHKCKKRHAADRKRDGGSGFLGRLQCRRDIISKTVFGRQRCCCNERGICARM